jgi:hypothetical protein
MSRTEVRHNLLDIVKLDLGTRSSEQMTIQKLRVRPKRLPLKPEQCNQIEKNSKTKGLTREKPEDLNISEDMRATDDSDSHCRVLRVERKNSKKRLSQSPMRETEVPVKKYSKCSIIELTGESNKFCIKLIPCTLGDTTSP